MSKKPEKPQKPEPAKSERLQGVVLQKKDIKPLIIWLDIPLHSEKAVARNRITKLLKTEFELFEADRLQALEKHKVMKDGKPELEMIMENGKEVESFKLKDPKKWSEEWKKMQEQTVTLDVLPSNRAQWRIVRDLLKGTKVEMDIEMTEWYEHILSAVEKV